MALLVFTIAVAVLSHGAVSYEHEGYSVHEFGSQDDNMHGGYGGGGGGGGKKFDPKLEVIHGPHEHIEVKGYSSKLEELGQHVEIPEPPIKVIRVTKTVAIKVPVPYPVRIKEKVPYPVTVHKPYPVSVPQIIKVPHVIPAHSAKPHTEHKQESAPVWPSKEHEQSEYSEYDEGDDTAKVSHDGGYGGGGGGSFSYGGGGGGVGEGIQHQALGGFSHDSGAGGGGGASFYPQQYNQGHTGASIGDFGGYHSAAAAPSGYGGGGGGGGGGETVHYDGAGVGSVGQHGGGGGGGGGAAYNFQPESNSYDAAIQEYLAKLKQQGVGGGDSYAGSYGGNSIGLAPAADDYHRVHEVETAKVDTVSYGH